MDVQIKASETYLTFSYPQSTANLIVDESMVVELEPVGQASNGDTSSKGKGEAGSSIPKDPRPFRHLVIDCTAMAFVDSVGVKTFRQVRICCFTAQLMRMRVVVVMVVMMMMIRRISRAPIYRTRWEHR